MRPQVPYWSTAGTRYSLSLLIATCRNTPQIALHAATINIPSLVPATPKRCQTTPQPSPRTSHLDAAGNNHKERKSEQAKEQTIAFLAACCLLPVHVLTGAIRTRQRRCLYRSQVNVAAAVESTRTRCNSYQEQHFKSHYFLAETAPRLNAS